ncbi:hypothetical protein RSSM_02881 [Rhodopirellula sallentina SM41]|uniref:Uncharacterized protein n=1 Tax=Rhodopirellula sallentina SM41 TaxID=1263870 RepID=M5U2K4_9BACT|nr:hypothetical protein RSSM_02881 [Rhodopirellula sallentina SM41]
MQKIPLHEERWQPVDCQQAGFLSRRDSKPLAPGRVYAPGEIAHTKI